MTKENQYKSLKLRGLPFQVTVAEIREFFADFRVAESDIILDLSHGKPTGYALTHFESEDEAARAKKELNRKSIGTRYVDMIYPDGPRE